MAVLSTMAQTCLSGALPSIILFQKEKAAWKAVSGIIFTQEGNVEAKESMSGLSSMNKIAAAICTWLEACMGTSLCKAS